MTSYSPVSPSTEADPSEQIQNAYSKNQNKWKRMTSQLRRPSVLCTLLTSFIFIVSFLSRFSCGGGGGAICQPQYTIQLTSGSTMALGSVRQALKVVSYFAKDLSAAEKQEVKDVLEDTLSDVNKFKFSFGGFCRENVETGVQQCVASEDGMDFFKSLIQDMGIQLAAITGTEDSSTFVDSIVVTYSNFAKVTLRTSVQKVERSTLVMKVINNVTAVVLVVSLVCFFMWERRRSISVLSAQLLVLVALVACDTYYIYRIHYLMQDYAKIAHGSGYYLLLFNVLLCVGQITYVSVKSKPDAPKYEDN